MRIWLALTVTLLMMSGILEGALHIVFTARVKPFVRLVDTLAILSLFAWGLTKLWQWALHAV